MKMRDLANRVSSDIEQLVGEAVELDEVCKTLRARNRWLAHQLHKAINNGYSEVTRELVDMHAKG